MDYQRTLNQKTLNRNNYKQHRSLRANKTLKQLVIMAVKSSNQEGLYFNQIKAALKNSINIHCSNFILKNVLQQLLTSNHLTKKNKIYKITAKKFNRKKKASKSRLSRKTRKRVLKQAKSTRTAMKVTVSGLLDNKYRVLEKVVMKAMRALKRQAVKSKTRTGFVFNQIKAQVRQLAKHKRIRNVVLIKALENLRSSGDILLKKGRNYLPKHGKISSKNGGKKKGKVLKKRKVSKKSRKSKIKNYQNRKIKKKVDRKANNSSKGKAKCARKKEKSTKHITNNLETESVIDCYTASSADNLKLNRLINNLLVEAKKESIYELKELTTTSEN